MRRSIFLIITIVSLAACKRKEDPTAPAPGKAVLVFPDQNALCTTGTILSNTQSTITLSWNSSTNTDGYEVNIKNLLTGTTTTQLTNVTSLAVTLLRNTPYSWSVTSKSLKSSLATESEVWRFYNAGLGTTTYAPFPPNLTIPSYAQTLASNTTTLNLTWICRDVDNDIVGYDLYFGTTANPPLFKSNVPTTVFNDNITSQVTVASGNTYYWKIVAKDSQGNISNSDVYYFKVN